MDLQPLTDAEFDRLSGFLERLDDKRSMNLEQLDGFLAALICGPGNVLPSECLRELLKDKSKNEQVFKTQAELQEFVALIMRHWNVIVDVLNSNEVFLPLLLEDENGAARANDWANGFMRGMELRREDWAVLLDDEEDGGSIVPIFTLAHEHSPDPEMRPYKEPITTELREKLIAGAAAGVMAIYSYFEPERFAAAQVTRESGTFRRSMPKIGRNEPCPCGSGKKFKQCCARTTLH